MQEWITQLFRRRGRLLHQTKVGAMLAVLAPDDRALVAPHVTKLDETVGRLLHGDKRFRRAMGSGLLADRQAMQRAIEDWAETAPDPGRAAVLRIRAWASEHGVADLLSSPVAVLAHEATVARVWRLQAGGFPIEQFLTEYEPLAGEIELIDAYLRAGAAARASESARLALWAAPCASPALDEASSRLKSVLAALPATSAFVQREALRVEVDSDACALLVSDPRAHAPYMKTALRLGPGDGPAWNPRALFARPAVEIALDALHDASRPLHRDLRHALEIPVWQRTLERVSARLGAAAPEMPDARVAWRVIAYGTTIVVEALVQKRGARGYSKGRQVTLEKLRSQASLTEDDERVLRASAGRPYAQLGLAGDTRPAMLVALAGHPRFYVGDAPGTVRVAQSELVVRESDEELEVLLKVGGELVPPAHAHARISESHYVAIDGAEVVVARLDPAVVALVSAAAAFTGRFPRAAAGALLTVLSRMPGEVGLELPSSIAGAEVSADPTPVLRVEPRAGDMLRAAVFVRPLGVGPLHRPGDGPIHLVSAHAGKRIHAARDLAAERAAAERLVAAGLDRAETTDRHEYLFDDLEAALDLFGQLGADPSLARVEWPEGESRWTTSDAGAVKLELRRAEHWFAASAKLRTREPDVSLAALMTAFRAGRRYVVLGPRRFARITDELRAQLHALDPVAHLRGSEVAIAPSAALYLDGAVDVEGDAAWTRLAERVRSASTSAPEVPAIAGSLRDYQIEGVRWLLRTSAWADGACLADEMGLGKTVQTIALLAARASLGPALVVCPTSVADNWEAELVRFAPALRAVVYRGAARSSKLGSAAAGTVLIASYDVVARDGAELAELELATLVLDEAHAVKNAQAQRTRAVRALRASFRVALTGTPLENRLSELHSLFSIVTPGLLGSAESFRSRFAIPIEKHGDRDNLEVLRVLLRPFLLRRTKANVARELPPRIDTVRAVELGPEESALYEAERRRVLERLEAQRRAGREGKKTDGRFEILAALTRLRRLACHPALVFEESAAPSSKLDALCALLDDLRAEGHRALVFSQFTSFLAFVRARLEDRGIAYLYLDGATPARERALIVQRWQEGAAPVFLISLKAGGTGLNLTAADYVVHLDPWWNPAVEDQASDRAHRIGQGKTVTVVRLVAQGTIEERVLELHADKRRLAEGVLEGSEGAALLDTDALLALLVDPPTEPPERRDEARRSGPARHASDARTRGR